MAQGLLAAVAGTALIGVGISLLVQSRELWGFTAAGLGFAGLMVSVAHRCWTDYRTGAPAGLGELPRRLWPS